MTFDKDKANSVLNEFLEDYEIGTVRECLEDAMRHIAELEAALKPMGEAFVDLPPSDGYRVMRADMWQAANVLGLLREAK